MFDEIEACVFDAYGTLFDVHSAAARVRGELGDSADALSAIWRERQLRYTWLRSLMGQHDSFWQITGDALDYAMRRLDMEDPGLRARLMELYLRLDAYPDALDALARLKTAGRKTAILSNGDMFAAGRLVRNAAADVLVAHRQIAIQPVGRRSGSMEHHLARVLPNDRIVYVGDDFAPRLGFGVMRIDVGDEHVVEVAFVRLLARLCEDIPRIRVGRDFPDGVFPYRFDTRIHQTLLLVLRFVTGFCFPCVRLPRPAAAFQTTSQGRMSTG